VFGDAGEQLNFDAYSAAVEQLAAIVEESELARVLAAAGGFQTGIDSFAAQCERIELAADAATLQLADGSSVSAALLIGAGGAQSAVRAAAGLATDTRDYRQRALVCNFDCERPHRHIAWQWFCDRNEGVLALLPLPGRAVSLVWSAPLELAQTLAAL